MTGGKRTWAAKYSSARGVWWMYVGVAVLGLAGNVAMSLGHGNAWASAAQTYAPWIWILVLVPAALAVTRSIMPRTAAIELDDASLRITRGKSTITLDRSQLKVTALRWEIAAGHELGAAFVVDDGSRRITIGARDRRIVGATRSSRNPKLYVEGAVLDELLPMLDTRAEVTRAGASEESVARSVVVQLQRNSNRGGPIALLIGSMFGGMVLIGLAAFGIEALTGSDTAEYMLMLIPLAAFIPMGLHMTHHRRGKISLAVDGHDVAVTRGGEVQRFRRERVTTTTGTVHSHAQFYGSYETPALTLVLPGGDTIRVGTSDIRLRWRHGTPKAKPGEYTLAPMDFQLLVGALGLAASLDVDSGIENRKLAV